MSKNDRIYQKALFKLELAKRKKKGKSKTEYDLFKELYFQLIVDKSLSKKDILFQIQTEFNRQNLKFSRSKFFEFQHKIAEEELKKDWWVTKRKKEIEEKNERLRKLGAKEIIMTAIDPKDKNPDDFINKKSKAIQDGIKKGSRKGAQTTKNKFI